MNQSVGARERGERRRLALAPGLVGAVTAIVGILAIGGDLFFGVSFVLATLALITGWFVVKSRQWWLLPLPAFIAVLWNPMFPVNLNDGYWLLAHYGAAGVFIALGLLIRVPDADG